MKAVIVMNYSLPIFKNSVEVQFWMFMTSSPKISGQIDGERMQTVKDFIFLGSKITADCDGSHVIKDVFSLEEKLWQT